jgi:MinD superfamily P-loop ATPase
MIFHGLKLAKIDSEKCIKCKKCIDTCRFDAINEKIVVNKSFCEGCGVCQYICPVNAVDMIDRESGFSYISETRFGPMAHAVLKIAEEASGKLITVVRENAKKSAEEKNKELIIIDGAPGIGCPVISAITGVDMVLIVTEPTLSGAGDLKRIIAVAEHFKIPTMVCINKFNINIDNTKKIEEYCKKKDIHIVGKIPYDITITKALIEEKNIIEYDQESDTSRKIVEMWKKIEEKIKASI